jgi:Ca2+-binding RTX toxin-like protein
MAMAMPTCWSGRAAPSYVVFGGAFGAIVTTNGTAAAEMLIGGSESDTLSGGGGGDVFHGGAGNDRLIVSDTAFRLADGGALTDTLALAGSGLSLDLTDRSVAVRLQGIERIDLGNAGDNELTVVRLAVLGGIGAVSGGTHALTVLGNEGGTVSFGDGPWTKTSSFITVEGTFDRYVLGSATVDVEQGINVSAPPIIDLSDLDGINGFKINGIGGGDRSGRPQRRRLRGHSGRRTLFRAARLRLGRELRGVRQGVGLRCRARPVHAGRQQRLPAQRRGRIRLQRTLRRVGRRCQR